MVAFGEGLFLACEDIGRMFDSLLPPPPALFVSFLRVEISLRKLIHSLRQD